MPARGGTKMATKWGSPSRNSLVGRQTIADEFNDDNPIRVSDDAMT